MISSSLFHKWLPFNGSIENPLVFIHGFLETHKIWCALDLDKLQRPILLIDVSGFGKSELTDENTPSIYYYALEINVLLNEYKVDTFSIIGHSMGGYIGLELLKLSGKIQKLILLNSNFWQDSLIKQQERTRVSTILLKAKSRFISEAIPNLFVLPQNHLSVIKQLIEEANKGRGENYAYATLAMRNRADFTSFLKETPNIIEII